MTQQIPLKGFAYYKDGTQLAIRCAKCNRAWKADRIEKRENQDFLWKHHQSHYDPPPNGDEDVPF